jgi:hypothetical protein
MAFRIHEPQRGFRVPAQWLARCVDLRAYPGSTPMPPDPFPRSGRRRSITTRIPHSLLRPVLHSSNSEGGSAFLTAIVLLTAAVDEGGSAFKFAICHLPFARPIRKSELARRHTTSGIDSGGGFPLTVAIASAETPLAQQTGETYENWQTVGSC